MAFISRTEQARLQKEREAIVLARHKRRLLQQAKERMLQLRAKADTKAVPPVDYRNGVYTTDWTVDPGLGLGYLRQRANRFETLSGFQEVHCDADDDQ